MTLKNFLGIALSAVMIGLSIYVLLLQNQNYEVIERSNLLSSNAADHQAANYRSYVQRFNIVKAKLEETEQKLAKVTREFQLVNAELTKTRNLYAETEVLLQDAQKENAQLQEIINIASIDGIRNPKKFRELVASLRSENTRFDKELAAMKNSLDEFDVEISNLDEGQALVKEFKDKIAIVQKKMALLNKEARYARIAAQKERDRIETLAGNNGFIVRNGDNQTIQNVQADKKLLQIDVQFVQ